MTTTTRPSSDAVSQLAADLEGLTMSTKNNETASVQTMVPTLQQFYQTGLLLFLVEIESNNNASSNDLLMAFEHLVESIPDTLLQGTFHHLQVATNTLVKKISSNNNMEHSLILPAAQSLAGLWTHSPRLCQVTFSKEWVSVLASMYDRMVLTKQTGKSKGTVLAALSALLLDGLFMKKDHSSASTTTTVEELLLEAIAAMDEESTDCLRDLQVWQSQHEPFRRTLESSLKKQGEKYGKNDEERIQQHDYILNMLESARHLPSSTDAPLMGVNTTKPQQQQSITATKTKASPADELDRRIQQVKQILPHLGEGFIEAALSLYQADVETTVATLLNDPSQYPSALRILDPSLPRRKKEHNLQDDADDAEQARQIVKEWVALEEEREAQRYQALMYVTSQQRQEPEQAANVHHKNYKDEYDDDYDDQYDEADIRLGGADDGFTMDMDFEQVKLYNQLVRDGEKEDLFWEENRNTNRKPGRSKSPKNDDGEDTGGKQHRGPDKIKGGRVIGPDGKIVKKPVGARKQNKGKKGPSQTQPQGGGNNNTQKSAQPSNGSNPKQPGDNNKKPRTKPKSDNRVNRRRDQKQRKQGTFGVQD